MGPEQALTYMMNDTKGVAEDRLFRLLREAKADAGDYRFLVVIAAKRGLKAFHYSRRFVRSCLLCLRVARSVALGRSSDLRRERALRWVRAKAERLQDGGFAAPRALHLVSESLMRVDRPLNPAYKMLREAIYPIPAALFPAGRGVTGPESERISRYLLRFIRRVLKREVRRRETQTREYEIEIRFKARVRADREQAALEWGNDLAETVCQDVASSDRRIRLDDLQGVALEWNPERERREAEDATADREPNVRIDMYSLPNARFRIVEQNGASTRAWTCGMHAANRVLEKVEASRF